MMILCLAYIVSKISTGKLGSTSDFSYKLTTGISYEDLCFPVRRYILCVNPHSHEIRYESNKL